MLKLKVMIRSSSYRWIGILGLMGLVLVVSPLPAQQKYELKYDFAPGKTFSHRMYLQGSLQQPGEDKVLHLQFLEKWEVVSGDSGQSIYTIRQTGLQYQGTKIALREFGLPPENEPIEKRMDVLGRIDEVSHYQKGSRYHLNCLTFPGKPVAVGESWKYSPTLTFSPFGRTVNTPISIIYTLEKVLSYKGRPCAKISISGSYRNKSESGDVMVVGEISGRAYFDLKEKQEVDYELKEARTERLISENKQRSMAIKITSLKE
jgi:hypothetical protein